MEGTGKLEVSLKWQVHRLTHSQTTTGHWQRVSCSRSTGDIGGKTKLHGTGLRTGETTIIVTLWILLLGNLQKGTTLPVLNPSTAWLHWPREIEPSQHPTSCPLQTHCWATTPALPLSGDTHSTQKQTSVLTAHIFWGRHLVADHC